MQIPTELQQNQGQDIFYEDVGRENMKQIKENMKKELLPICNLHR